MNGWHFGFCGWVYHGKSVKRPRLMASDDSVVVDSLGLDSLGLACDVLCCLRRDFFITGVSLNVGQDCSLGLFTPRSSDGTLVLPIHVVYGRQ